jgi:hypothetical protein
MSFLDKAKGLISGHKSEVKSGLDKVADVIEEKVPDQYDAKVEQAADAAKNVVDKLD